MCLLRKDCALLGVCVAGWLAGWVVCCRYIGPFHAGSHRNVSHSRAFRVLYILLLYVAWLMLFRFTFIELEATTRATNFCSYSNIASPTLAGLWRVVGICRSFVRPHPLSSVLHFFQVAFYFLLSLTHDQPYYAHFGRVRSLSWPYVANVSTINMLLTILQNRILRSHIQSKL